MAIYSANLSELAKPIKKRNVKKSEPVQEEVASEQPVKEKKKRELTEKQRAALEKGKETRKRKAEEALQKKLQEEEETRKKEEEQKLKEETLKAKKEAQKEKRRLARLAKKEATQEVSPPESETSDDKDIDEAIKEQYGEKEPPKKKQRKTRNANEPPAWFIKYVEGVKKEEARYSEEKKPAKIIKQESLEMAQSSWKDGLTRDRVLNEVDNHQNRMYHQIFGTRRM